MLRFSQTACKRAFDAVFVRDARSLKPDLILAQWDHLGDFQQISGDERCLLPPELWAKDEDYLWYSTGGAANYTDLTAGVLGEGTLQARYLRGASGGKPFVLGKYEQTRVRVAIAELAANGGAPMGFYARFKDPAARKEIVRYYRFLERYDAVYRGSRSHAEVLLLYPRSRVHAGDVTAVEAFKGLGRQLLDRHVLFDVLPDDGVTAGQRAPYRRVIAFPYAVKLPDDLPDGLSRFEAPATLRVSASRPAAGNELTLHFVNYNRKEPEGKRSPGRGIADENPIPAGNVPVDLALPAGFRAGRVHVLSPEEPEPKEREADFRNGRLRFVVPSFLVYAIARVGPDRVP
jgi:hypothetical protein